jgi:hypothetical protein
MPALPCDYEAEAAFRWAKGEILLNKRGCCAFRHSDARRSNISNSLSDTGPGITESLRLAGITPSRPHNLLQMLPQLRESVALGRPPVKGFAVDGTVLSPSGARHDFAPHWSG